MIEYIYATQSVEGSAGLLAIVIRNDMGLTEPCKKFITESSNPLQLGLIKYNTNEEVTAHIHLPRTRSYEQTQEFLVIKKGTITIKIYDVDGQFIKRVNLSCGDCILLLAGGHSLRSYENSEIIEVKTGPYLGRENDKINIKID